MNMYQNNFLSSSHFEGDCFIVDKEDLKFELDLYIADGECVNGKYQKVTK